jgi:hypothetical protein
MMWYPLRAFLTSAQAHGVPAEVCADPLVLAEHGRVAVLGDDSDLDADGQRVPVFMGDVEIVSLGLLERGGESIAARVRAACRGRRPRRQQRHDPQNACRPRRRAGAPPSRRRRSRPGRGVPSDPQRDNVSLPWSAPPDHRAFCWCSRRQGGAGSSMNGSPMAVSLV